MELLMMSNFECFNWLQSLDLELCVCVAISVAIETYDFSNASHMTNDEQRTNQHICVRILIACYNVGNFVYGIWLLTGGDLPSGSFLFAATFYKLFSDALKSVGFQHFVEKKKQINVNALF